MIRVLGKGITAQAIKETFKNVILYDDTDFNTYDKVSNDVTVVSPGIPPYNEMVKNSNNIISDYDLIYNEMPFSIWISGTNGKTTTTQMCQHILKERGSICGGNIGTPVTKLNKEAKIWILETSSFTFHYTNKAKPNLYLLLPISDDHISWHGSFEEYESSKLKPLYMMEESPPTEPSLMCRMSIRSKRRSMR
ncbi:MAG: Mur ligase family protein [Sphaerochaetaceae bacterium]|nr:Mur ligase family protein [Sphaerochaetaceae bacterium]